jgi:ATP-dependent DNA helicase
MENSANTASTSNGVSVKVQAVFDAQTSRDKMSKLQTLLTRAQAYSKFLADRLQEQIAAPQPESKRRKGESQVENITGFAQPTLVTGGPLRGYQLEGVQWLVSLYENGLNGILADEMGLGKTVQCIAFLSFLREQGVLGPFLIVAPLSTLANWMSEWARWSPTVPALMYHGNQAEREAIRRKHLSPGGKQFSAVVTSYEVAMRDARYLSPLRWKYLIIDEGHRLKNFNCRLIRELKAYHSDNRLLITGTPLHNNLTELWSLLNFLLPEIFTDVDDFLSWFDIDLGEENDEAGEIECAEMISKLHLILKPLLLRRLKVEVEAQLPRKREYVLTSTLTTLQREYYQAVLEGRIRELISNDQEGRKKIRHSEHGDRPQPKGRGRQKISYTEPDDEIDSEQEYLISSSSSDHDDETPVKSPSAWSAAQGLQNKIMQLRKVCNHPYLFRYPTDPQDPANLCIDEALVESSGKMRLLDQLLNELLRRGHKVLIFSQMSRVLDILSDYLDLRGWSFSRIDGSVPQLQRQVEMQHFNEDPKCCIFLLSTRAGGLGINLVAADTVIFYDSDWVLC